MEPEKGLACINQGTTVFKCTKDMYERFDAAKLNVNKYLINWWNECKWNEYVA